MLQSPDGNWIAYQSNLLSRPGLLTKRKSLVYSVLERESGVVSAYDEMGSETEPEAIGVWGAALVEFQRKMSANKKLSYPESYSRQATLPLNAETQQLTAYNLNADTEDSAGQDGSQKTLLSFMKRKVPLEHRRPSSVRRPSIMDINFNPGGAESSEDGLEESRVKRSRRRRKNKREEAEGKGQSVLSSDVLVRMTVCYSTCLSFDLEHGSLNLLMSTTHIWWYFCEHTSYLKNKASYTFPFINTHLYCVVSKIKYLVSKSKRKILSENILY